MTLLHYCEMDEQSTWNSEIELVTYVVGWCSVQKSVENRANHADDYLVIGL